MPWPTMNAPGQWSPRRESASSFSSTTVTSQSSCVELERDRRADPAAADDQCFHEHVSQRSAVPTRFERRPAGRRRSGPRPATSSGRSRRSARRSATGGATAAPSRARSGRPRSPRRPRRSRRRSPARGRSRPFTSTPLSAPSARASASEAAACSSASNMLGVERHVERHLDHVERLDRRAVLLREPDRRRDHLLADLAELHRHEDAARTRASRQHLLVGGDDVLEQARAAAAPDQHVDDEARERARPGRRSARPGA